MDVYSDSVIEFLLSAWFIVLTASQRALNLLQADVLSALLEMSSVSPGNVQGAIISPI